MPTHLAKKQQSKSQQPGNAPAQERVGAAPVFRFEDKRQEARQAAQLQGMADQHVSSLQQGSAAPVIPHPRLSEAEHTPEHTAKARETWSKLSTDWQRMQKDEKTQTKPGATLARRMGVRADNLWQMHQSVKEHWGESHWLTQSVAAKLAEANARSSKFQAKIGGPETFMSKEEIKSHLDKFGQGAHAFITGYHHRGFSGAWGGWGKAQDRNFVAPLPAANELIQSAKKEEGIRTLEKALGIPAWSWVKNCENKTIYRYIIPPNKIKKAGLEMARGFEGGAYPKEWIAGGNTEGGEAEAVVRVFRGGDFTLAKQKGIVHIQALKLPNTPEPPVNPPVTDRHKKLVEAAFLLRGQREEAMGPGAGPLSAKEESQRWRAYLQQHYPEGTFPMKKERPEQ